MGREEGKTSGKEDEGLRHEENGEIIWRGDREVAKVLVTQSVVESECMCAPVNVSI